MRFGHGFDAFSGVLGCELEVFEVVLVMVLVGVVGVEGGVGEYCCCKLF